MTFRIAKPSTHLLVQGIERNGQVTTKSFPPQFLQSFANWGNNVMSLESKNFIHIFGHSMFGVCLKQRLPTTMGRPAIASHQWKNFLFARDRRIGAGDTCRSERRLRTIRSRCPQVHGMEAPNWRTLFPEIKKKRTVVPPCQHSSRACSKSPNQEMHPDVAHAIQHQLIMGHKVDHPSRLCMGHAILTL